MVFQESSVCEHFEKKDTLCVKGVAILMMMCHHLLTFPERIPANWGPFSFFGVRVGALSGLQCLGQYGQLCVAIFLFLAGFGLTRSVQSRRFSVLQTVKRLMLRFWKVFLLVVPLCFLLARNQGVYCEDAAVCQALAHFDSYEVLRNFFCLSTSLNREWWFLQTYILLVIAFPVWYKLLDNRSLESSCLIVLAVSALTTGVFPWINARHHLSECLAWQWIIASFNPSFLMGMVMAKAYRLEKFGQQLRTLGLPMPFLDATGLLLLPFIRECCIGHQADPLFSMLFVFFAADLFTRVKPASRLFELLGRHSMNMYLMHSFFCFYVRILQRIVFKPGYLLLMLPWFAALCLAASLLTETFWGLVGRLTSNNAKATPRH